MESIESLQKRYPGAVTFRFGDSAEMSSWLLRLVRAGQKTATCGALRDFAPGGEPKPVAGRRDIALNWDGTPALVIETVSVEEMRFDEVGEEFALAEGENETFEGWQRDHRAYFDRHGGWSPDMMLICERFRVIEDLA
ncbi:ASCH domain-containing protein [Alphaproteobacteria bacterium GH1-50]|uniref:ASCH domain-containing protein n=1 Tax=Kangsaoukella pontilimi TaxID=2691042 RepID=A0A7C9ISB2_9RHOB|nr:ASCH domain-containing protein [Kangsaoukella pontilimi]MXQ07785.1 ASCH domain-containing protein [Kangsaoukella pontilimi]